MGRTFFHWRWFALLGMLGIISVLSWKITTNRPSIPRTLPVWGTSAISVDGTHVATSTAEGIAVWSIPQLQQVATISTSEAGKALAIAWSPDGSALAIAGDALVLYRIADGQATVVTRDYTPQVPQVAWSQSGTIVAIGHSGMIDLWQLPDLRLLRTITPTAERPPLTTGLIDIALSADGTLLATSSLDRRLRVWQVADGTLFQQFRQESAEIGSIAFSPDGQLVAVGVETMIQLWRIADGTLMHRLQGHRERVTSIAWSADGQRLASGAGNTQSIEYADTSELVVKVWTVADGTLETTFTGHHRPVSTVAFLPNGQEVISTDGSGVLHMWSLKP